MRLSIKNYRSFGLASTCDFHLEPGVTAIVGPNNCGKTQLLRMAHSVARLVPFLASDRTPRDMHGDRPFPRLLSEDDQPIHTQLQPTLMLGTEQFHAEISLMTGSGDLVSGLGKRTSVYTHPSMKSAELGGASIPATWEKMIPGLREVATSGVNPVFVSALRYVVGGNGAEGPSGLPVGGAFVSWWAALKTGDRAARARAMEIEKVLASMFGYSTVEIVAPGDQSEFRINVDDFPHTISELGRGFHQALYTIAQVAVAKPSLLLIDEPESGFHPAAQLEFMNLLTKYCTGPVIFATHSLGLARACADRIYYVSKDASGESKIRPYSEVKSLSQMLGEMSFSAYQELGCERILLVEGPTEVRVYREWLAKLKADHKVAIFPLGGRSMIDSRRVTELLEFNRMLPITVVVDSEASGENCDGDVWRQRKEFASACKHHNIRCHLSKRRATENYFGQHAIDAAFPNAGYSSLGEYERAAQNGCGWSKNDNWKIAAQMTKEEVIETDIGAFLAAMIAELSSK